MLHWNLLFWMTVPSSRVEGLLSWQQRKRYIKLAFLSVTPKTVKINKPPPLAVNVTLLAIAVEHQCLLHGACSVPTAIDQYLLPAGQLAANLSSIIAAVDQWDTQSWTYGRTDTHPSHWPCAVHTVWAASINLITASSNHCHACTCGHKLPCIRPLPLTTEGRETQWRLLWWFSCQTLFFGG